MWQWKTEFSLGVNDSLNNTALSYVSLGDIQKLKSRIEFYIEHFNIVKKTATTNTEVNIKIDKLSKILGLIDQEMIRRNCNINL